MPPPMSTVAAAATATPRHALKTVRAVDDLDPASLPVRASGGGGSTVPVTGGGGGRGRLAGSDFQSGDRTSLAVRTSGRVWQAAHETHSSNGSHTIATERQTRRSTLREGVIVDSWHPPPRWVACCVPCALLPWDAAPPSRDFGSDEPASVASGNVCSGLLGCRAACVRANRLQLTSAAQH